jgi:hypothetical protein
MAVFNGRGDAAIVGSLRREAEKRGFKTAKLRADDHFGEKNAVKMAFRKLYSKNTQEWVGEFSGHADY